VPSFPTKGGQYRAVDHLALIGRAIRQGIPVATDAAVACPDRKIVCFHGDDDA
jgi:acetolactate synthase-1/2/3 large subunit